MRGSQFAGLSAFVTVAEEKSFTKAAKILGLSTATLSQTVSGLEERLGVRLLTRTTRNVALTDAGERLLTRLRPVLDDYEAAVESINAFRDKPCGSLRITVPPPVAEFLLAPILSRFMKAYPDISLEVAAEPALANIVTERFDAGMRAGRRVERDMIAVKFANPLQPCLAASPAYLKAHGTPQTPEDLKTHRCIRYRFPRGLMPWEFEKRGKPIEVAVNGIAVVNEPRLANRLAVDGVGILYHAEPYMRPELKSVKLVALLEDWMPKTDDLYLYYPSRRQNPATLQAFIEFLKREEKGWAPR
jgi:DNA-binding transcriptional LysR family regulator